MTTVQEYNHDDETNGNQNASAGNSQDSFAKRRSSKKTVASEKGSQNTDRQTLGAMIPGPTPDDGDGFDSPTKFKMADNNRDFQPKVENQPTAEGSPEGEVLYWEFGPVEVKEQTEPFLAICYKCKKQGMTEVYDGPSKLSYIMCLILCALGFVCCCLIPILPCAKKWGFRDYQHLCPHCRALVAVKRHDIRSRYKTEHDPENPEIEI